MKFHSDTFVWFWSHHSLMLLLSTGCFAGEAANNNVRRFDPTNARTNELPHSRRALLIGAPMRELNSMNVFFAILNLIAIRNVISLKHNSMALILYHYKDDNMVKMLYYLKHNMVKMLYAVKLSIIVWWFLRMETCWKCSAMWSIIPGNMVEMLYYFKYTSMVKIRYYVKHASMVKMFYRFKHSSMIKMPTSF